MKRAASLLFLLLVPALACSKFGDGVEETDAGPVEAGVDSGPEAGPASAYATAVLDSRPVVFWRFAERDTTSLADLGSATLGATSSNVVRLGQPSLVKEGGDSAIQLVIGDTVASKTTTPDWFSENKPFSVELWIRLEKVPTSSEIVMHGSATTGFGLVFESDGKLRVGRYENGIGTKVGKAVLPTKANHHVVATYNGAVLSLYVDGKIDDSQPDATKHGASSLPITIGTSTPSGGVSQLDATLDEVAFYDRDLALADIVAHAKAGGLTP